MHDLVFTGSIFKKVQHTQMFSLNHFSAPKPVLTGLTKETCHVLLLEMIIKQTINKLIKRKAPRVTLQQGSQKTEFGGKAALHLRAIPGETGFPLSAFI